MLRNCGAMFSLEIPEDVMVIEDFSFYHCHCLRNVVIPPDVVFGNHIFIGTGIYSRSDLRELFVSESEIIRELQHRFDRLPIRRVIYYQPYYQETTDSLSCGRHEIQSALDITQ